MQRRDRDVRAAPWRALPHGAPSRPTTRLHAPGLTRAAGIHICCGNNDLISRERARWASAFEPPAASESSDVMRGCLGRARDGLNRPAPLTGAGHPESHPNVTSFADLGLSAPILRAVQRRELHHADADPGQGDPPRPRRPRPARAAPRPAPARRRRSRCRSCSASPSDVRRAGPQGDPRLVLTPTRELAAQIGESFATYGKQPPLRHTVIFGGVGQGAAGAGAARAASTSWSPRRAGCST